MIGFSLPLAKVMTNILKKKVTFRYEVLNSIGWKMNQTLTWLSDLLFRGIRILLKQNSLFTLRVFYFGKTSYFCSLYLCLHSSLATRVVLNENNWIGNRVHVCSSSHYFSPTQKIGTKRGIFAFLVLNITFKFCFPSFD